MRDLGDLTERAEAERARYRSALVVMKGSQQKRAAVEMADADDADRAIFTPDFVSA